MWDVEMIKDFPKEYMEMRKNLTNREIEILEGAELQSHEGMVYGAMLSLIHI